MQIVAFLDLDDTIFQTAPKCPNGEPVRPVAFRHDGSALSFMTERQHTLLEMLFRSATVIPATARSLEAFRRVDLPFRHAAILDFGGVVLQPGGALDTDWDEQVRPRALQLAPELRDLHRSVDDFLARRALGAVARVITDFDLPLYLVVKHPTGDLAALRAVREEHLPTLDLARFFVHGNENNLSLVPRFLGKEKAVAHVLAHHVGPGLVLTLGLGDSLSDAPFLDLCDFSILPRRCQLAQHRQLAGEGG
jgi:hypothetical protein